MRILGSLYRRSQIGLAGLLFWGAPFFSTPALGITETFLRVSAAGESITQTTTKDFPLTEVSQNFARATLDLSSTSIFDSSQITYGLFGEGRQAIGAQGSFALGGALLRATKNFSRSRHRLSIRGEYQSFSDGLSEDSFTTSVFSQGDETVTSIEATSKHTYEMTPRLNLEIDLLASDYKRNQQEDPSITFGGGLAVVYQMTRRLVTGIKGSGAFRKVADEDVGFARGEIVNRYELTPLSNLRISAGAAKVVNDPELEDLYPIGNIEIQHERKFNRFFLNYNRNLDISTEGLAFFLSDRISLNWNFNFLRDHLWKNRLGLRRNVDVESQSFQNNNTYEFETEYQFGFGLVEDSALENQNIISDNTITATFSLDYFENDQGTATRQIGRLGFQKVF